MMPLWLMLAAIAQALALLSESPKSLAAAAAREAIRRQIVGPSVGSYNNDTLSGDREMATEPAAIATVARPPTEAVDRRDESWWREQVKVVREKIRRDEEQLAILELEIPRLDGQAISRDDPVQQASLRQQANGARNELEARRIGAAASRGELSTLLEEARRLNVPPGWLR